VRMQLPVAECLFNGGSVKTTVLPGLSNSAAGMP